MKAGRIAYQIHNQETNDVNEIENLCTQIKEQIR